MVKKVLGGLLIFSMVLSSFIPVAVVNAETADAIEQEDSAGTVDVGPDLENENLNTIINKLDLFEVEPTVLPNRYENSDGSISIDFIMGDTGEYDMSFTVTNNPDISFYGIACGMALDEANNILKDLGWPPSRGSSGTIRGYYNYGDNVTAIHLWINNDTITAWEWRNFLEGDISENPFTDVPYDAWFYDSVIYVFNNWIMTGLDSRTFGPSEILSRAQFATILYRMEGEPDVSGLAAAEFPDVPDGIWYDDAVTWASASGIITGYTEGAEAGTFGASDAITRAQMATMMYRYAEYKGYDITTNGDLLDFPDAGEVPDFAADGMLWAVDNGIITGDESEEVRMLKPQNTASRAVGATIITRFLDQIA